MSKHPSNRISASKDETRDAILQAAFRVLGRFGYPKTSMVDVAREAGMGRATLYLYFNSKEAIALAAMNRVNEQICGLLREIATQEVSAGMRLREMLRLRVLYRFDFAAEMVQSMDDVFRDVRAGYLARRDWYDAQETAIFANILAQGRKAGDLAFDDADQTAATLLSCTNSLLPFSLSARELRDRDDVSAQVERTTDLMLRALRHTGEKK